MALALMRRHRRWLYVFLWLVIAAFIILYIPAFQGEHQGTPGETVVKVGEESISVGEFQRSFYRQRQELDRLYQGKLDESMLRRIQQQVLESLVAQRLVEQEARRLGIKVSDDAVAGAIPTLPEYQRDGAFIGAAELRRILDLQGTSEEQFTEELRRRLMGQRLAMLVGSAADVSEAEVERELRRRDEQVKLEYVLADAARFRAAAQPSEPEIEARFQARKNAYEVPEKRVVNYALLDREAMRSQVAVNDSEIQVYYGDHREEFRQDEEACAHHLLVKVKQGETGEGHADAEAQKLAEGLLAEVKNGADFATIARRASEDAGSKEQGGDLGCFPPGRMVPAFDNAAFEMKPGETSGLVKTSFGYHVIHLDSRRESTVQPLAQVKERVRAILLDRKMSRLAEDKAEAIAQALAKGKQTLEQAARAQGLAVKTSEPFARTETPPVLGSPTLVARAFQLKPGEAEKEAFSLPQGAAFIALSKVIAKHLPELGEVREKVRADIVEEKAFEEARSLAESVKAKAVTAGLDKAAGASGLVRKETPQLVGRGQPLGELGSGLALDEAAFSLPEKTLSDPVRSPAGWAVLRVLEKKTIEPAQLVTERDRVRASLLDQKRSELFRAFLNEARERYAITRNPAAYKRALGEQD